MLLTEEMCLGDQWKAIEHGVGACRVISGPGTGKCLGINTPVMLFDGTVKSVQDIQIGDVLMGPDSRPRKVMSTNTGHGPLFRITPVKGMSWVCNDVHVMTLAGTKQYKGQIIDIPLDRFMQRYRPDGDGRIDSRWKLLRVGVDFPKSDVAIDPYLAGLWVGDGTTAELRITTPDVEIINYLVTVAHRYGAEATIRDEDDRGLKCVGLRRVDRQPGIPNIIRRELLGKFRNQDGSKTIPQNYLINSRENRLQLLAGLIDTDGYLDTTNNCYYDIVSKWKHVAEQILFLARSLGFAAYMRPKTVPLPGSGELRDYYRIGISGDVHLIPCRVVRKQATERQQIKDVLVTGWSADSIGDGDYYGFTLDGDGRFLLGDFTVTHNTTVAANRIARLVTERGVDPTKILAVTFNKDAQVELRERSTALLLEAGAQLEATTDDSGKISYIGADVRTYHSAGYLIARDFLKLNKFEAVMSDATFMAKYILGDGEMMEPWKGYKAQNGPRYGMRWNTEKDQNVDPKEMCALMDRMKESMILPSDARAYFIEMLGYPEHKDLENYCTFYALFHKELRLKGKLTFADMLFAAWLVLTNQPNELKSIYATNERTNEIPLALSKWQQRWDYFIVDEAQDTNPLQGEVMCALLSRRTGNIMTVGDSNQAIYRFRGAKPDYIENLMNRYYPGHQVYNLDHTRRFVQEIVDVSNTLITYNPQDEHFVPLKTARSEHGSVTCYDFFSETEQAAHFADTISEAMTTEGKKFDDFGIIARTNATIAMIEPVLFSKKIMYRVLGGGSVYNRKEVKVAMGFITAMVGSATVDEILECINVASKDDPKGTHFLGEAAKQIVTERCERNKSVPPAIIVEQMADDFWSGRQQYIGRGLGSWAALVRDMDHEAKQDPELGSLAYVQAARALAVDAYVVKQYGEKEEDGDSRFEVLIGLEHLASQYPNVEEFIATVRQLQADAAKPKDEQTPAVRLGTAHRWKGLEADTIFIASMNDSIFPHKRSEGYTENMPAGYGAEGIREERRLAFVAVTRGKNHVVIGKMGRSLFCEEMGLVTVATQEAEEEEILIGGYSGEPSSIFVPAGMTGDIYTDMDAVAEELDWLKSGFGGDNYISPERQEDIAALDNLDFERGLVIATLEDPTLPVPAITRPEHEILTVRGITDLFDPTLPVPPVMRPGMEGDAAQASFRAPITPVKKRRKTRSKKSIA